jgi:hypothetical protein
VAGALIIQRVRELGGARECHAAAEVSIDFAAMTRLLQETK